MFHILAEPLSWKFYSTNVPKSIKCIREKAASNLEIKDDAQCKQRSLNTHDSNDLNPCKNKPNFEKSKLCIVRTSASNLFWNLFCNEVLTHPQKALLRFIRALAIFQLIFSRPKKSAFKWWPFTESCGQNPRKHPLWHGKANHSISSNNSPWNRLNPFCVFCFYTVFIEFVQPLGSPLRSPLRFPPGGRWGCLRNARKWEALRKRNAISSQLLSVHNGLRLSVLTGRCTFLIEFLPERTLSLTFSPRMVQGINCWLRSLFFRPQLISRSFESSLSAS